MVLLQGLLFGRALMDSLARRGVAPVCSTARLTRNPRKSGIYRGKSRCINPYETNELLQRLGGSSVRHLSTKTSSAPNSSESQSLEEILKDEVWIPVYRFRGIHYGVLAAKTKLALTFSSILLIPIKYWQYLQEEISISQFTYIAAFASFSTLALIFFCRFFNHLIGVISMNETNEYVRIGYLSFWGYRRNKYLELEDVVPLSELATGINRKILQFRQYSSQDIMRLPTFNVEIIDEERAAVLFGDLAAFFSSLKKNH